MLLQREIRVVADAQGRLVEATNRWSGGAVLRCGQTQLVCSVVVSAPLDVDGVAVEVHEIDELVRSGLKEVLQAGNTTLIEAVNALFLQLARQLAPTAIELIEVSLATSAQSKITMRQPSTDSALVTQQFEFSAAHRLFGCSNGEERTARDFGKCARVHGHNYVLDVTIRVDVRSDTAEAAISGLERVVSSAVLAKLDHRYLNDDVVELASLNPTVEQIAVVIWNLLTPNLGASLAAVRLYETPKTWAEYHGPLA